MKNDASLRNLAVAAVRDLLLNPDTPPSVRLRAANLVLQSDDPLEPDSAVAEPPAADPPPDAPAPDNEKPAPQPRQPYVAPPTPGRNERCVCGSGLKFKRCCLSKTSAPAPACAVP